MVPYFLLLSVSLASPVWMKDYASYINSRKLHEVDMPGAHHAGFISTNWWGRVAQPWAKCQTDGITDLLNRGARYLDIRLGERRDTLYFSHSVISEQKWDDGLNEINNWIRSNPSEILILDIAKDSDFKIGTTNSAYPNIPAQLENTFQGMIISSNDYKKLNVSQLVAQNKRIALVGDTGIGILPRENSWGETQAGNWGTVIDNVIKWLSGTGRQKIDGGVISISSAAVTPFNNRDYSPPLKVAADLNSNLAIRIRKVSGRIGVIMVDGLSDDIVAATIEHNKILTGSSLLKDDAQSISSNRYLLLLAFAFWMCY